MKPITLTEILNLDDDLNNYHNRVQQRFDYIQAQLAIDPNFVAYDVLKYVGSKADSITQYKYIVGTDGSFYSQDRYGNWRTLIPKHKGGSVIITVKLGTAKTAFSLTRAIASTFIPMSNEILELNFSMIKVMFDKDQVTIPTFQTTQWCSASDVNNLKFKNDLETKGIESTSIKPLLAEVTIPGKYLGTKFILAGVGMFKEVGWSRGNLSRHLSGILPSAYGCKWRIPTKEELEEIGIGVTETVIEFAKSLK